MNSVGNTVASTLRHDPLMLKLLDSMPIMLAYVGRDGRYQYANRAYLELWNKNPEELLGRVCEEIISPELYPSVRPHHQWALEGKQSEYFDKVKSADGHRYFRALYLPHSEEGAVLGFYILAEDLTDQKVAQMSERSIREFAEALPMPAWVADQPGDSVFYNQKYRDLLPNGVTLDSHEAWKHSVHPDDLSLAQEAYRRVTEFGGLVHGEYRRKVADGSYRWHFVTGVGIKNDAGDVVKRLGTAVDIEERKSVEAALRRSEEQLRLITDAAPALISYIDRDLIYRFANRAYTKYWGVPRERIIGMSVREFVGEAVFAKIESVLKRVLEGQAMSLEIDVEFPCVGLRRVRIDYVPDGEETESRTRGCVVLVNDITEARAVEQKAQDDLRKQQSWLEDVLNKLPTPLFFIEPQTGQVTFANDTAKSHIGDQRKAISHAIEEYAQRFKVTDENDRPLEPHELPAIRAARGERIHNAEVVWHTAARRVSLLAQAERMPAKWDRPETILFLLQDITQLKKAEREQRAAHRRLEEAIRARDEFLSIASHELKTPLTNLKLQAEIRQRMLKRRLPQAVDPAQIEKDLEADLRQIERINRLVSDMLDVSRIHSGKLSIQPEVFDLRALVLEVSDRFRAAAEADGGSIEVDPGKHALVGKWDRFRIEQVVSNLLSNALRYGERKPVRVSLASDGQWGEIRVQDEGIGIAKEHHERIFQRFERAVSANDMSGLGLGLFISQQIVQMHGGSIRVESELSRGSVFVVRLPCREGAPRGMSDER